VADAEQAAGGLAQGGRRIGRRDRHAPGDEAVRADQDGAGRRQASRGRPPAVGIGEARPGEAGIGLPRAGLARAGDAVDGHRDPRAARRRLPGRSVRPGEQREAGSEQVQGG
jgi:hypothetical protein